MTEITDGLSINVTNGAVTYEAWPSLTQLSDGALILGYRTAPCDPTAEEKIGHYFNTAGKKVIRKSTDDGLTWGSEITAAQVADNDNRGGGILAYYDDENVEMLMHVFTVGTHPDHVGDEVTDRHTYINYSSNGGTSWSEPEVLLADCDSINNPIQLSNGDILHSMYDNASEEEPHFYIARTEDLGESWTFTELDYDGSHTPNETTMIEIKDNNGDYTGDMLMYSRLESDEPEGYWRQYSTDYGATWTNGSIETQFPEYEYCRCELKRFDGHTLLFSYNQADHDIVLVTSPDEGDTWKTMVNAVEGEYVLSHGYPSSVVLRDWVITAWCDNTSYISDVHVTFTDKNRIIPLVGGIKSMSRQRALVSDDWEGVTATEAGSKVAIDVIQYDDDGNIIGAPSPAATITDNRKTVTTAGTELQLLTASTPCQSVTVTALRTNTGYIAVGGSSVVAAAGTEKGIILEALDSVTIPIDNVNKVYIDSTVNGEGVSFTYLE